jgi:hypothetical protein
LARGHRPRSLILVLLIIIIIIIIIIIGARGSAVKALGYKPEGRGFETPMR